MNQTTFAMWLIFCINVIIGSFSYSMHVERLHLIYKTFQLDFEYKGYSIFEQTTSALNNSETQNCRKQLLIQVFWLNETKV